MLVHSAKLKWMWYGALVGLIITLSDLTEWRGPTFAEWSGEGLTYNLSMIAGSIFVGAFIGLIAGAIRDSFARRSGKMM